MSPLKSGLGAQLGIAPESGGYGVYAAPTTFLPFTSESLALSKEFVASQGLRANRFFQSEDLHVGTTRQGGGDITLEFLNKAMGKLLNLLHGDTVTPTQIGATTAYEQTHEIGVSPPDGKSLSVQVGRPDTGGTVRAFSYLGCKVVSWSLAVEQGGLATVTLSFDAQDETLAEALGVATYPVDAIPFNFTQMVVNVGGSPIGNVRSVTINGNQPQAVDRFHLGNAGVKDEPIVNAFSEVTAAATLEFANLDDHNRFKNETVVELALEGTGALIEAGHNYEASVTLSAAKQTSSGPTVGGPDIITTDVEFMALDNGTDAPVTVYVKSTDTAL